MGGMGKSVQRMGWKAAAAPVPAKKGWGPVPKAPDSYWDWLPEELRDKILDEARLSRELVLAKTREMERSELEYNTAKKYRVGDGWDEDDWAQYVDGGMFAINLQCLEIAGDYRTWDHALINYREFTRHCNFDDLTRAGWEEDRRAALARQHARRVRDQWDRVEDGLAGSAMQRYLAIT